jgi:hypothetical protein
MSSEFPLKMLGYTQFIILYITFWLTRVIDAHPLFKRGNLTKVMDISGSVNNCDTDTLMALLCTQDPGSGTTLLHRVRLTVSDGRVSGAVNVETGVFLTYSEYMAPGGPGPKTWNGHGVEYQVFQPIQPWEVFVGTCSWQLSYAWEWDGPSDTLATGSNTGSVSGTVDLSGTYHPFPFSVTWSDFEPSYIFTTADEVADFQSADASDDWAYPGNSQSGPWLVTATPQVPPCSEVAMTYTPSMRSIILNAVFEIEYYAWDRAPVWDTANYKPGYYPWTVPTTSGGWRGKPVSDDWNTIYSAGYYMTGTANIFKSGTADFTYSTLTSCTS